MTPFDLYRSPVPAGRVAERIQGYSVKPVRFMEFCGGHTASILRHGIRQLLPGSVELLSGPGCPVCVTAPSDLDKAVALAARPDIILATFGDMIKVPGSRSSLQDVRAGGGDVRIVYSVQDALRIAQRNRERSVVFMGIGFETTAPTVAASVLQAAEQNIENYFVLSLHKKCPPVMQVLLDTDEVRLDGILCPGHVSAVIGSHPYGFIPREYGIACAISGFEPLDILLAVEELVRQVVSGLPRVAITYRRGVRPEGNPEARAVMERVFEECEAEWRGIGSIQGSGLRLRPEYRAFDAECAFPIRTDSVHEPAGCLCGEILRGVRIPLDCLLFSRRCTPEHPVGPCMVSSEGSCAAYFHYGEESGG